MLAEIIYWPIPMAISTIIRVLGILGIFKKPPSEEKTKLAESESYKRRKWSDDALEREIIIRGLVIRQKRPDN
jgi:hypothetical protein